MSNLQLSYCNFFITDYDRSLTFFRDQVGLTVKMADESFGYASFDTGHASVAFARVDINEQPELVSRHTGIGFASEDINLSYEKMSAAGVQFEMPPTKQPWGGVLALFKDPDGNIFYLDQLPDE